MIRYFDTPWVLAFVPVALGLALLAVLGGHKDRRERLARFGSPAALARLGPPGLARRPRSRAWRLALAAAALAIGLAGPRWGEGSAIVDSEGVDVALALDVSLSMLAEDERPNRLERMKQEVRRFRASAPGDRVALLAFAGRSYILSPLTSDDGALELFLENLDPTMVGSAGSAMAQPLRQGLDLLMASQGGADRALVVMSDGEAFDDRAAALAIAGEIERAGVLLVTVGFGSPGGAPIPLLESGGADVKRDANGEVVVTRYDDSLLRELARAAGGEFIPAEATDKGTRVRRALADLETTSREEQQRLSRPLRFQWFAALALALLLIDAWLADGGQLRRRLAFRRRAVDKVRRTVAPVAFLLVAGGALLLPFGTARAQRGALGDAIEHHREGRLVPAIRAYRSAIASGDRRPIVMYDLGTALLGADSLDAAIEALERATFAPDAGIRTRALYNLGLAYLKRGLRTDGDTRSTALRNARRALRTVLLERPGDRDAQWNYELALRAPQGGGGGGGGGPLPPQQQGAAPRPQDSQGQMSRQQAEALLEAASRDERETQARRQRGSRTQRTAGERDW
ncbi:MAG: vWA domain-containing protein [Gemmatimonadaceae bacterium]